MGTRSPPRGAYGRSSGLAMRRCVGSGLPLSISEQAVCLECHAVSHHQTKTCCTLRLQDLPFAGMTVYHVIKTNRYVCENPGCPVDTFTEQFEAMVGKDARLTHRLKEFIVQQALDSSANALTASLRPLGIRVSRETILRLLKARGATVVAQNVERDDVRVLSVDDINLRKGQPWTACSVFIDGETHRVLVIAHGASEAIAEKVMRKFPTVEMVSRRGFAYAAAAATLGNRRWRMGFIGFRIYTRPSKSRWRSPSVQMSSCGKGPVGPPR